MITFKSSLSLFGLSLSFAPISLLIGNASRPEANEKKEVHENIDRDKEAKNSLEKLDDYSFKIFLPCGNFGTGWILDYEIPEEGSYPTKWYIATNAHIANHFLFVDNPYEQELPKSMIWEREKALIDTAKLWKSPLNSWELCDAKGNANYFDFNLSKQKTGKILRSNYGAIGNGQVKTPRLFYVPVNFLKKNPALGVNGSNYRDFAVIEVEFTNQNYAKEITGDFYEKYGRDSKIYPIDVFAFPWAEKENKKDSKNRLYSLGYPYKKEDQFGYSFSYDPNLGKTSEIASDVIDFSDHEGHVSATDIDSQYSSQMTYWNGRNLNRVGDFYLIDNFEMGGGSSGGLVIDGSGEVWGIRSMGNSATDQTLAVPLRSNEITSGSFKTPAYDLIVGGVEGQLTSYRQQVQKYVLKRGKETWLSRRGGWKYAPDPEKNYAVVQWWQNLKNKV